MGQFRWGLLIVVVVGFHTEKDGQIYMLRSSWLSICWSSSVEHDSRSSLKSFLLKKMQKRTGGPIIQSDADTYLASQDHAPNIRTKLTKKFTKGTAPCPPRVGSNKWATPTPTRANTRCIGYTLKSFATPTSSWRELISYVQMEQPLHGELLGRS